MENNEDNRQMTVIAAEIERQEKILEAYSNDVHSVSYAVIAITNHTISVLESLLPKEKEQIVKFGIRSRYDKDDGEHRVGVEKLFNETFKPYKP